MITARAQPSPYSALPAPSPRGEKEGLAVPFAFAHAAQAEKLLFDSEGAARILFSPRGEGGPKGRMRGHHGRQSFKNREQTP
ncbi:hypothetical protein C7U61_13780 [Rhizobium sp. JAB6]|nr:hypothetical protein C7U61_13780 [Rhizobium sp. JAB6]